MFSLPSFQIIQPGDNRMERPFDGGLPHRDLKLGARLRRRRCVLYLLLFVPDIVRASDTVREFGCVERAAFQGNAPSATEAWTSLQRYRQKARMQAGPGLQLHHTYVDSRGDSFPHRGNTTRCDYGLTHHLLAYLWVPRLLHCEPVHPVCELFPHR